MTKAKTMFGGRILCILTVLVIFGIFTACQKRTDAAAASGGDFSKRVTLYVTAFVSGSEGDGRRTDPVSKYIEEKLNINLELSAVNESDYPTQISALMAANDLPDIFLFIPDYSKQLQALMASNSLLSFEPYLQEYAPNTLSDPNGRVMLEAYRGPAFSPDGKAYIWGVEKGTWDDGTMPVCGHYLLWDVYKKAGYPKLESYDNDLLNVLEAMVKAEPLSLTGQKTYGLGGWFGNGQGWGEWVFTYGLGPQEGVNLMEATARTLAISTVDSTPININQLTDTNSIYWRTMRFYNKANQRGLLDPDSFIQTSDEYGNKVNDGRYMFNVPGWMSNSANFEFSKTPGNTKTFISLPSISGNAEDRFGNMYKGDRMYGISARTKNPERCVALLDLISSYEFSRMAYDGVEGMNWKMEAGKPVPAATYLTSDRDDALGLKTGAYIYHHLNGYGNGSIDPVTGVAVDLYQYSPEAAALRMNDTVRDFCAHYGKQNLTDVYLAETPVTSSLNMISFGEIPEDIVNNINALNAYIGKNFTKVIAAKTDAEFVRERDALIAGMANYNVDGIFRHFYNDAIAQGAEIARLVALMKK